MKRPSVSLIVPFAGGAADAARLARSLEAVRLGPEDEAIVVDNSPVPALSPGGVGPARVIADSGERTSYYARNVAVEASSGEWLVFIDADCTPAPDLVDAYLADPPGSRCGLVAGAIVGDPAQDAFLARWARWRLILDQGHGRRHPYRPFASTANLMVRRAAYEDAGGFAEGIVSGGDADFCWRVQELGWELEPRPDARVVHAHRERLGGLVRQAGRYGRGQAWLERRHPGVPRPSRRAAELARAGAASAYHLASGRFERAGFRAVDGVFLASLALSRALPNRPRPPSWARGGPTFLAGSFPPEGGELPAGHVEAARRPLRARAALVREADVAYLEDDSLVDRVAWWARLALESPARTAALARPGVRTDGVLERLSLAPAAGRARRAGGELRPLDEPGRLIADELAPIAARPDRGARG